MRPAWRERVAAERYDAIVVGAGPNGLAAAITIARAGRTVLVLEGADAIGGGLRSEALTLPGFLHDACSAIHPLGAGSPFFRSLPLHDHGLEWIHPEIPLAHPLDEGTAAVAERSIETTAARLGVDGPAYRRLYEPLARKWIGLDADVLAPFHVPRHPFVMAGFGLLALRSARGLAEARFREEPARALFAGIAGHSILPLEQAGTAAAGVVLGTLAHAVGWPLPKGGSQRIAEAMASYLRSLGGEIVTGAPVASVEELPAARAVLFDVTPRQLLAVAGDRLPPSYRRALARYRYGPGVFKLDLALAGPIPWRAAECRRAGTVHAGGTLAQVAAGEAAVWRGEHPERPLVLVAQQSLFDATRAPAGKHTVWAYCHVPHGSTVDMTATIEAQIERFAPGFGDLILARSARGPRELEARNPNLVGGDIGGGVLDLRQLFTRPTVSLNPYRTPARGLYLCSSSTPPGGGVHGMCGFHAARTALADMDAHPAP
jgi:phytoene dehydrogenase-like protein